MINQFLPIIESQLIKYPFITGNTLTLADITILAALDATECSQIDLTPYEHIVAWRNKLMNESFYTNVHLSDTDTVNNILSQVTQ